MIELTPETIESTVMKSPLPVAVFFTSKTCAPCRAVYALLDALAPEYTDRLTIVKADVEVTPEWRAELKVMGIPVMVIFKNGKETKRIDPRNKGDMRLHFDAVSAAVAPAADQKAVEAASVYGAAVKAAQAAAAISRQAMHEWWMGLVGVEAVAMRATWKPLKDATDEAVAADPNHSTLTEEAQFWAWVQKRTALKAEPRFAQVMAQIEIAEAAFHAACEPHYEERSRRYDQCDTAYEAAIQSARLAYHAKTGNWPSGDLVSAPQES